ncbi:MAG TPA: type II toxin-antitoxin system HicA family toxin [Verrucomicrobiae bacterium]|nr:type II toxin-antitoxin system HicA family toxin [Verrucomicrobiae bacterium]
MKLPRDVTGQEAARALKRLGFIQLRQTGSHLILRKTGRTVVVPQHKPIKPGHAQRNYRTSRINTRRIHSGTLIFHVVSARS